MRLTSRTYLRARIQQACDARVTNDALDAVEPLLGLQFEAMLAALRERYEVEALARRAHKLYPRGYVRVDHVPYEWLTGLDTNFSDSTTVKENHE